MHVGDDTDNDNARDVTEDAAPNNGDGNNDGIPDSTQSNVTSIPSETGQGYITIETTCHELQKVNVYIEKAMGTDSNYDFPYGLVSFKIPCSSATVRIYFHGATDLSGYVYRKYSPTPPDFDTPRWYTLPNVTFGTVTIEDQTVAYAEFTLVDGGLGDDTPADGMIVDQGGPAFAALHEGGYSLSDAVVFLFIFITGLVIIVAFVLWRRKRKR